jgi:hypothetical protein
LAQVEQLLPIQKEFIGGGWNFRSILPWNHYDAWSS